ncbi:MAG: hypothetical protein A07HR60_02783 [uncultured archaeon A07HR60]|nr:MAG: hypothetical protein A07HR60_02783 [uncultured archaeon A07HR60]
MDGALDTRIDSTPLREWALASLVMARMRQESLTLIESGLDRGRDPFDWQHRRVNYPTLLAHRFRGSLPEGGASCFDDALSIHDINTP